MSVIDSDKIINVALIGHVANGKTTLVELLTGVSTKRDSQEQKSGRTIKLGYANCMFLVCDTCSKFSTISQDSDIPICCDNPMKLKHRISFVDAPGHHSYVETAIKGVAIVDCAILVSDVRSSELQPQTIEHIAILNALNIDRVLVVQNKVDLVKSETCLKNFISLKSQLEGTIVQNSVIVPISAQSGLGLDSFLKEFDYLLTRVKKSLNRLDIPNFSIVRSFDINRPGTKEEDRKPGVIGGSVLGGIFSEGDDIEIRPGTVSGPIKTKILAIYSEKTKVDNATSGGLYGISIPVPSELTRDNLSGQLMGKPGTLPETISRLEIRVKYLFLNRGRLREGETYNFVFGNTSVKGKVVKKSEFRWCVELGRSICTREKVCLIYSIKKVQSKYSIDGLVAYGELENREDRELTKDYRKYKEPECTQTLSDYESIVPIKVDVFRDKVIVPTPVVVEENSNLIWTNMESFCTIIHREPDAICSYIKEETNISVTMRSSGELRLIKQRKLNQQILQRLLSKFITTNICCHECNGLNTRIMTNKKARSKYLLCEDCKSHTPM